MSMEFLAAEDLRWLPKQRSRGMRYTQTCWNPDVAENRKPVLTSCAQDEVVEVAFALSHHEAVKIAETPADGSGSSGTTRTRRSACKYTDSAGTRGVSQSETKGYQQFPQTRSGGGGYEIWTAMQEFDADALGHYEKVR